MNNNIGMSKIMRSFEDGFLNMKTSIIAVLWAVHPFEHIGKEIAQIEIDTMNNSMDINVQTTMLVTFRVPSFTNEQQPCEIDYYCSNYWDSSVAILLVKGIASC